MPNSTDVMRERNPTVDHRELNSKLDDLIARMIKLEQQNIIQSQQMKELTEAWITSKGLVAVIKWLVIVGGSFVTAWVALKGTKL